MSSRRIFRYFKTSAEIARWAVTMQVYYPLSSRNVEDLLNERGIDMTHEIVRFWWNHFGTILTAEFQWRRAQAMRSFQHRQWHLDEIVVKIAWQSGTDRVRNPLGVKHHPWRAVDCGGEVLESFVTKRRDKKAASNCRSAK